MSKSLVEKAKTYVESELKKTGWRELDEMHDEEYHFVIFNMYGLDLHFTIVEEKVREGEGRGINIMIEACKSEGESRTFGGEFNYCPGNYTNKCFVTSFYEFRQRFDEGLSELNGFLNVMR